MNFILPLGRRPAPVPGQSFPVSAAPAPATAQRWPASARPAGRDALNFIAVIVRPQAVQKNQSLQIGIGDILEENLLGDSLRLRQAMSWTRSAREKGSSLRAMRPLSMRDMSKTSLTRLIRWEEAAWICALLSIFYPNPPAPVKPGA